MSAQQPYCTVTVTKRDLGGNVTGKLPFDDAVSASVDDQGVVTVERRSGNTFQVESGEISSVVCTDSGECPHVQIVVRDLGGDVASEQTVSQYDEVWQSMRSVKIRADGETRTVMDGVINSVEPPSV